MLPIDIKDRISRDFPDQREQIKMIEFISEIFRREWNIGSDQFCRAIVILIDGDVELIEHYKSVSDPRDVVRSAERKLGNPGHYFTQPFNENE